MVDSGVQTEPSMEAIIQRPIDPFFAVSSKACPFESIIALQHDHLLEGRVTFTCQHDGFVTM